MKQGLVRYEMTCPKCDKISYQANLCKDFTFDCPHCNNLNHFSLERGNVLDFDDYMNQMNPQYDGADWQSVSISDIFDNK